ncbi:MAG: prolyl oligopeptidase family serine peptidase [Crocinitomicaceae bacterium]|nr:prolyl oligopeptidase family serine peptidase [Crocinitomicaceae bacterium]
MQKKQLFKLLILLSIPFQSFLQLDKIQLKEIMKGDEFVGKLAYNQKWHLDGKSIIYQRKINGEVINYKYFIKSKSITEVNQENLIDHFASEKKQREFNIQYFIHDGVLYRVKKGETEIKTIFKTNDYLFNLQRTKNESIITFQSGINLYEYDDEKKSIIQITNFINNEKKTKQPSTLLEKKQNDLFAYFSNKRSASTKNNGLKKQFLGKREISKIQISPDRRVIALRIIENPKKSTTKVPSYITKNGYTQTKSARPKVSNLEPNQKLAIYDVIEDSLHWVNFSSLKDIRKRPSYLYQNEKHTSKQQFYKEDRAIFIHQLHFNNFNNKALIDIRSADNKDRWIVSLNTTTFKWEEIEHQHDEAWIGGPGISGWNMVNGTIGWIDDGESCYFQSEESGYSHLYMYDFKNNTKQALTSGNWEVYKVELSTDKRRFYITCNKSHRGNRDFYHLDIKTKKLSPILIQDGYHDVSVSPDEKSILVRYSFKNKPWELYLGKNKTGSTLEQISDYTNYSFKTIKWQEPEVIQIKTSDNDTVYARLYTPNTNTKNNAAVIFVHGAGYLQNAHNYWSSYFREYMFHNLLLRKGYTILDIDFRASKGYGRNHRTAIYRHMGGKDLSDQIDGKRCLIEKYGIDENKIGIYGGSYGGFITLMALLKHPGEFACGAALRSVTDWMHYNYEYTSNILNYPSTDSIAYYRSSPINFAQNLEDPLLILHGMEDSNVQFQDVVRLSQRFIELEKTNWELAVFPVEGHSFKEASSWLDEYRRIFNLFNRYLLK